MCRRQIVLNFYRETGADNTALESMTSTGCVLMLRRMTSSMLKLLIIISWVLFCPLRVDGNQAYDSKKRVN